MDDLGYTVKSDENVDLRAIDPSDTHGIKRADADERTSLAQAALTSLQETHFAAGQNGILIVLQGLDTAGKDGTIRHVMAAFNPASCRVESFKVPTAEESAHDFLWRVHRVTPPLGSIAIFNRSHYEDVLVTRVHHLLPDKAIDRHYEQINHFEQLLVENSTIVLKFFLYISNKEQKERLEAREADHTKAWKLSASDWPEHALYDQYVEAYELALSRCSTKSAPWHIVPADHKWYRNLAVAETIVRTMHSWESDWQHEVDQRGKAQLKVVAAAHATRRD
jgi:PPK2 family polyphosphate:nucleotide phosphotransferase